MLEVVTSASVLRLLKQEALKDAKYQRIKERVEAGTAKGFRVISDLVYTVKEDNLQLLLPEGTTRGLIISESHDNPSSGHLGRDKTLHAILENFYWPGVTADVTNYVNSCFTCQSNKSIAKKPIGLLKPLDIPHKPWRQVSMDFIVQLPLTTKGNDAIFVCVDRFSKMAHFVPCKTTITAVETAKMYFDHIWRLHGMPLNIV